MGLERPRHSWCFCTRFRGVPACCLPLRRKKVIYFKAQHLRNVMGGNMARAQYDRSNALLQSRQINDGRFNAYLGGAPLQHKQFVVDKFGKFSAYMVRLCG